MKNRIENLFDTKSKDVISIFFTAGYPNYDSTLEIVEVLDEAGVDLIEIGIPFSDPLADGKIIQDSSSKAISSGMTLSNLFNQLTQLRTTTQKPVLLMGYLNSVMQYGIEAFYSTCNQCGIDGVILPDLPLEEYEREHKHLAEKYHVIVVFLLSPLSLPARVEEVKKIAKGFVYLVSSNSTTGNEIKNREQLKKIIPQFNLNVPVLIGFGIKDKSTFRMACDAANGAIIGSEFIRRIGTSENIKVTTTQFMNELEY